MTFFKYFFFKKPNPYDLKGLQHEIFENRIRFRLRYSTLNHFRICSDRWNRFFVCSAYFEWWFWNGLWFPLVLSMRETCLLVAIGWGACAKIGSSMAEQWACVKIISVQHKKRKKIIGFFRIFTKIIYGFFDLGQQNSKLSHACVPLKRANAIPLIAFLLFQKGLPGVRCLLLIR